MGLQRVRYNWATKQNKQKRIGIIKSVPENIRLSKDLSHQIPWSTQSSLHPELPQGGAEGQQLKQHRVQSPQRQMANALVQSLAALLVSANLQVTSLNL